MWNNTSFPLPLSFVLPLLHHPIYLCVALSGFPHSAAPVLSGPIRGRIFIDLQPPVPGALLLRGLPRSLLPLPSSAASGLPPTPGATDAQCAAQSICHQLSAFSGAMKCGKMGQQGWGGRGSRTVGRWREGGRASNGRTASQRKTFGTRTLLKLEKYMFTFSDCSSQQTGSAAELILQIKSYNLLHVSQMTIIWFHLQPEVVENGVCQV